MDALSALRLAMPTSAALRTTGLQGAELPIPDHIPAAELQQLPLNQTLPDTRPAASPASFEDVLGGLVSEVNQRQLAAADQVHGLLTGQNVSLHETMISLEEASLSFQLMVEVRNKLLESYQELMRMQV